MNRKTPQSYFDWVGEVGELAATVFRAFSTEPVLVKEPFSVEGVLVTNALSIEPPRVRDPLFFETLEERAWGLTTYGMSSPSTEALGLRGGGWCGLTTVGDRGGESSSSAPMQRRKRTRSCEICEGKKAMKIYSRYRSSNWMMASNA